MTNREAFATALAVLFASFDRKLTPEAIEGYWLALEGLTEAELLTATKRAVMECRFMPAPAELLALSGRATVAERAALAWEAVRAAMDRHDYTASVDFGPLVNAVVRNLGGWYWLCDQKLTALPFVRKDFERVFAGLAHHDPATLHGDYHTGSLRLEAVTVAIEGERPSEPRALPPAEGSVQRLIADLANAKDGSPPEPPKLRASYSGALPRRVPVAISEDEKRVAIERMKAALAARQEQP